MPAFNVLVAVEDSGIRRKFLSLARRRTGVYLATFMERFGGVHTSYHNDGSYFFRAERIEGPDPPPMIRTPLAEIRGMMQMTYASYGIPREEFDRLPALTAQDAADRVISLELSSLAGRLAASIYLIQPGHAAANPVLPGRLVHSEHITDVEPWIGVDLYAGTK